VIPNEVIVREVTMHATTMGRPPANRHRDNISPRIIQVRSGIPPSGDLVTDHQPRGNGS